MTTDTTKPEFKLNFIDPFTTFTDGEPTKTKFVIDGLLVQGGFSILTAKPKTGKSSLARYAATCVASGRSFLGRDTERGGVILVSLEDQLSHVDNHLSVLGHDPKADAKILIVDKLPTTINETIKVLRSALEEREDVRLLVLDTLAKILRVRDLNDYVLVLDAIERLHDLARSFPHLHILAVAHSKKAITSDAFDGLLGSTALRGEGDANIAIFQESGQRIIQTEVRTGRNISPSVLHAEVVEVAGTHLVREFRLGDTLEDLKSTKTEKRGKKHRMGFEESVIAYLQSCAGRTAQQEAVLREVRGRREDKLDAIERMADAGVLNIGGVRHSPVNPLTLTLNPVALAMYDISNGKFGTEQETTQ